MSMRVQTPRRRVAAALLVPLMACVLVAAFGRPAQAVQTAEPAAPTADPTAPAVTPTLPEPAQAPLVQGSAAEIAGRTVPGPPPEPPTIGAPGAVLFDPADQVLLFQRDAMSPRLIASLTKVMTVLLALEEVERGTVAPELTVSQHAVDVANAPGAASLDLEVGETVPVPDVLAGLVIRSGNDGAVAVAEHVAGNETAYVALMNVRAAQLGMEATNFINSSGLTDDQDHHSSPLDLVRLGVEAMRHPDFAAWAGAATLDVPTFGVLENRNEMLTAYPGTTGIKTGFTNAAGMCLLASAERDGRTLYAVVLGSEDRVADTSALFDFGFDGFARPVALAQGATPHTYRWSGAEVALETAEELARTVTAEAASSGLTTVTRLAPDASLPVEAGTPLGEVALLVDGEEVDRTPLLAATAVPAPSEATAGSAVADALRAFARLSTQSGAVNAGEAH